MCVVFFFQAEDGIRDLVRSRGLGDVYKRQGPLVVEPRRALGRDGAPAHLHASGHRELRFAVVAVSYTHLTLPTSDLV